MTDTTPPSPLAEQALQRLRRIAEGNGLAPDAIQLFAADEKMVTIEATMTLSPLFETTGGSYTGGPRGHDRVVVSSRAALKSETDRIRQQFESKPTWIGEAITQLKEQPAEGWGLDDVKITLPSLSVILAGSETCPTCQGNRSLSCQQCNARGSITCPQCQGNRQEICPICLGSGMNPSHPTQQCINCNGIRYTPCRYCHGSGQLTCPSCRGQRGTACPTCQGAGIFTEEVAISCGARTQFKIKADGLPSGLRRGLDRLGIAKLANGHADIESIAPPPDEDDANASQPHIAGMSQESRPEKGPKPEIHYLAHMPYADLRMSFAGKKAVVGVFGKKNVLLGVPAFLDTALQPARNKLKKAAKGGGSLHDALGARLMKDALTLQLACTGKVNDLRRMFPLGLTPNTAQEILSNMRLALNRLTLRTRSMVASVSAVAGSCLFAGFFLTDLHGRLAQVWSLAVAAGLEITLLISVMSACWFALSAATRFSLQKRFPEFVIPITQKTGKTGWSMLAALVVAFVGVGLIAPQKPEWLELILKLLPHTRL